ncbi:SMP-30/gluconolactonase/LRE family protein [Actinoallomurus purpureus]|uniref:SMP-30/gluconolactonase/LRE family protein n=1 Tax=Actinoallomurus purpureus TaxID=478114 RepID=UPI0020920C2B|nr:SMP-30/gluconolactonase/LRE family protein [Actinoallomurus purpureus]MCO6010446.1 SMP-30/gluconolactonase/LRE family protein [Actinoallomurus purpureus]
MSHEISTVVDQMSFTECPRWRDGRIWFADFYTCRVLSAAQDGSDRRTEAEVPGQPSGLGWLPDGRLLIVSQHDRTILRRETDGTLAIHADISSYALGHLNDMIVDSNGRAYVGNFGFDLMAGEPVASTSLVRVDPDGTTAVAATDLWFPNGAVVTPDGVLLVDETFGNRITAFDITADGTLTNRRTWAAFGQPPQHSALDKAMSELVVAPDGCTLDAEGCLWVADAIGGRAVRVREGGEIVDEIVPGTGVFACALGGSDGHTLFLCVAPDFLEANRKPVLEAQILATRVDVPATAHA